MNASDVSTTMETARRKHSDQGRMKWDINEFFRLAFASKFLYGDV